MPQTTSNATHSPQLCTGAPSAASRCVSSHGAHAFLFNCTPAIHLMNAPHTLIHASTFASSERLLYSCVRVCVAVFMWYRFYYLALTVFVVVNIMCLVVTLPLHTVIWAVMFLLLLASFANFSAFHVQRRWSSWIFHHSFRPPSTRFTSFLPLSCGFAACRFSCLLLCLCLFL